MQRPRRTKRPEAHIENMPHEWLGFNKWKPEEYTELEIENDGRDRRRKT